METLQGLSRLWGYDMEVCSNEEQEGPINKLPPEMILPILSRLDHVGVSRASQVCTSWQELSTLKRIWKNIFYKELVFFGKREWEELGYTVAKRKIDYRTVSLEALKWASAWPKEWDRKMMCFAPKEIKSISTSECIPLTAIKIGELIGSKLGAECNPAGYKYFWNFAKQEHGGKTLQESCWVYMTPDVILGSRNKDYQSQCLLAQKFGGKVPELPSASMVTFLKAYITGTRMFSDNPWTYTRCQEKTNGKQLAVGGFALSGLGVSIHFDFVSVGVAALRKF